MNRTLKDLLASRYDLSEYLFHFTKGSDAKSTLEKILADQKLKDINSTGVLCFTEAPLYALVEMFDIFEKYNNPMYSPYGVGILKSELFNLGARPVIYGPEEERQLLDPSIQWRYESYVPNQKDFSWLREWRINESEFKLDKSRHLIITKSSIEELLYSFKEGAIDVDGCMMDGQFRPEFYQVFTREWKSISLETIKINTIQKGSEIDENIAKQNIGDNQNYFLGS